MFQSMFSVIAMEQFKLSAEHNGMVMSYLGALSMLMQVILTPDWLKNTDLWLVDAGGGSLSLHITVHWPHSAQVLLLVSDPLLLPPLPPQHSHWLPPAPGNTLFWLVKSQYNTILWLVDVFLLLQIPLVCSLSLINSILQSRVTKIVPSSSTGTMLGLNMAVHSVIRSLSPSLGAVMMSAYGYNSIGQLGVICNVIVVLMIKYFKVGAWVL